MRKYNSSFKAAFLSEAGAGLTNNDYFAFVELDKFACYVIADGISDLGKSESAKEAIHTIISEFQNAPSMSGRALERYLRAAHRFMRSRRSYEKLKASVTVVVTDYVKMRYAYAGNTRLRVYRDGHPLYVTYDMSLSQDLVKEDKLRPDAVATHIERNNLHTCLGMDQFTPFVSAKIKLKETDIIALYTRGIWENIDEGELKDLIADIGNDPQECCNQVEDLLMSRQPQNLENYTYAAIFVEKVFVDPNLKKKRKKIIIISVVAFLAVAVIIVVIIVLSTIRRNTRTDMDVAYENMLDYIDDGNFIRAKEEGQKTADAAKKIFDKAMRARADDYLKLLEAVIRADEIYDEGKYDEAGDAYISAQVRSRYADNAGMEYLDQRMERVYLYREVYDNIALGDSLMGLAEYALAEQKYNLAKQAAAAIYFDSGKEQALAALETLYAEWAVAKEEEAAATSAAAADQVAAAELIAQGDAAYEAGDLAGAKVFYLIGLEKYTAAGDTAQMEALDGKMAALEEKQAESADQVAEAKLFEAQAQLLMEEGEYALAKEQYQLAKNVYQELGLDDELEELQGKMDLVDGRLGLPAADETVSGNNG